MLLYTTFCRTLSNNNNDDDDKNQEIKYVNSFKM
jgi:hypothetical protein